MEIQELDLLLRLVIAHLLADFIFQTDRIAEGKKNKGFSWFFVLHITIVGILTCIIINDVWGGLTITAIHAVIDFMKIKLDKDKLWAFVIDQFLHFITLVAYWLFVTDNQLSSMLEQFSLLVNNAEVLIVIIGYLVLTVPTGVLISYFTRNWQKEIEKNEKSKGLPAAGKWIGIIERILVLTFILFQAWQPIGFLLAAKSVFRFGDLKQSSDRKKTEYILIGTLLSFSISILFGIYITYLLSVV